MSSWNEKLRRRKKIVRVKEILVQQPDFMVIRDQFGKEHKLTDIDFLSFDWERIKVDSEIELTFQESIVGIRVLRKKPLGKTRKSKLNVPYYMWVCEAHKKRGYIEYETGDELQIVESRIYQAHEKACPGCDRANVRIFDHNGMELKEFTRLMSFEVVE